VRNFDILNTSKIAPGVYPESAEGVEMTIYFWIKAQGHLS